ncbi:hypothetical protein CC80DRAFT_323685 [Byssothecium circinans]|uniref:Uncharacterized protein n=1 Tax=Byssothecium circinans TaxID=147558 RepID=A0A6A5U2U4_9PLEO|nr:hypothetical protein CC80DRAFT_323685 [Byssothecium circinans]
MSWPSLSRYRLFTLYFSPLRLDNTLALHVRLQLQCRPADRWPAKAATCDMIYSSIPRPRRNSCPFFRIQFFSLPSSLSTPHFVDRSPHFYFQSC